MDGGGNELLRVVFDTNVYIAMLYNPRFDFGKNNDVERWTARKRSARSAVEAGFDMCEVFSCQTILNELSRVSERIVNSPPVRDGKALKALSSWERRHSLVYPEYDTTKMSEACGRLIRIVHEHTNKINMGSAETKRYLAGHPEIPLRGNIPDRNILAAAHFADIHFVVTFDHHFLHLKQFENIFFFRPKHFVDLCAHYRCERVAASGDDFGLSL